MTRSCPSQLDIEYELSLREKNKVLQNLFSEQEWSNFCKGLDHIQMSIQALEKSEFLANLLKVSHKAQEVHNKIEVALSPLVENIQRIVESEEIARLAQTFERIAFFQQKLTESLLPLIESIQKNKPSDEFVSLLNELKFSANGLLRLEELFSSKSSSTKTEYQLLFGLFENAKRLNESLPAENGPIKETLEISKDVSLGRNSEPVEQPEGKVDVDDQKQLLWRTFVLLVNLMSVYQFLQSQFGLPTLDKFADEFMNKSCVMRIETCQGYQGLSKKDIPDDF